VGTAEGHVYAVPLRTVEGVARIQASVTEVDANMLSHGRETAVRRAAFCLEMDRAVSKTECNYEVAMV
jgi:hypothetical protein